MGPMSAMPARNVVIATTVETTPIPATASEAARVERQGEPAVREGEGHAEDRRRLGEVQRQDPRGHAGAEAAAQDDVGGVDERRGQGPGDAGEPAAARPPGRPRR